MLGMVDLIRPEPGEALLAVTSICLLTGCGSDKLVMTFNMREGIYPWAAPAHATMEVTKGDGVQFIVTNFNGVDTTIIDTSYRADDNRPIEERKARIVWDGGVIGRDGRCYHNSIVTDAGTVTPLPGRGYRQPVLDDPDFPPPPPTSEELLLASLDRTESRPGT